MLTNSVQGLKTAWAGIHLPGTASNLPDDTPASCPAHGKSSAAEISGREHVVLQRRTPHALQTLNGSLTLKTSNGTDYEVSFSTGDDHPMPLSGDGSFSGTEKARLHQAPRIGGFRGRPSSRTSGRSGPNLK